MTSGLQVGYILAIVVSLVMNLYIIHLCDRQRTQTVARFLGYLTIISNLMILSHLGISLAPSVEVAFFWARVRILLTSGLAVISLGWVLYYLGLHTWLRFPRVLLLAVIPSVQLFVVIFDSSNEILFRSWRWIRLEVIGVEVTRQGGIIQFSTVYYALIILLAFWMLRYRFQRVSHLINVQMAWMMGGIFVIWLLANLVVLGFIPPGLPNLYPFAVIVGGMMVIYGLRLSPLVDVSPVAYELVFNNMSEYVIVLSNQSVIADANPIATKLFAGGRVPLGQSISRYPELAQALGGDKQQQEIGIGEQFYKASVSKIYLKNGTVYGNVLMLTDITERKKNERERERLVATLDAYSHTVAHDLRNPVSVIRGYLELADMSLSAGDSRAGYYVEQAQKSIQTMTGIINLLLLLATLRSADELEFQPLDMPALVQHVLDRLVFDIERTQAQIHVQEDLPAAYGYANWVKEVWLNYLSNAMKYGGSPPIIHIRSELDPNNLSMVRYSVQDNGVGITREEQSQLFQKFNRLDRHSEIEGHGLGLLIVRQMVERMGGRVGVQSKPNEGSTFYFVLPVSAT